MHDDYVEEVPKYNIEKQIWKKINIYLVKSQLENEDFTMISEWFLILLHFMYDIHDYNNFLNKILIE